FLVVVENDDLVPGQRRRSAGSTFPPDGIRFQLLAPQQLTLQVKGPQSEVPDVYVNCLPVGDWCLGGKAALAMASAWRMPAVELLLPGYRTGLQIQAIEPVVQHDFIRHLDIALYQFGFSFFLAEAACPQLAFIISAVCDADLRSFRLAFRHCRRQEDLASGDDRRRPPAPRNRRDPLDVLGLRPAVGQPFAQPDPIQIRPTELRPIRLGRTDHNAQAA